MNEELFKGHCVHEWFDDIGLDFLQKFGISKYRVLERLKSQMINIDWVDLAVLIMQLEQYLEDENASYLGELGEDFLVILAAMKFQGFSRLLPNGPYVSKEIDPDGRNVVVNWGDKPAPQGGLRSRYQATNLVGHWDPKS
jgi:hypothetical protein